MDPSPGNMAPSCPVALARGTRNTMNPMIQHPNAAGPADWMTAALVMNRTMATKIATMSNVLSTLGRMPPATFSEIRAPVSVSVSAAMATLLSRRLDRCEQLDLGEVLEALVGGVGARERRHLGPLHGQVGATAQVAERFHQQVVGLQGIQGL